MSSTERPEADMPSTGQAALEGHARRLTPSGLIGPLLRRPTDPRTTLCPNLIWPEKINLASVY